MPTLTSEDYVFFCPGMDLAAMRAGELRRLDLGCGPEVFLDGLPGGSQFRCGRTADEKPFDDRTGFYLGLGGCGKKFH